VTVVGDLDLEKISQAAAQTFGCLPERRAEERYEERRKVPAMKTGFKSNQEIETTIQKSLVLFVFPTTDGIDALQRRTLSFLGQVVNDRLRIEIREKLGAAYSPMAASQSSEVFPGDGMLMIQAMSDPDKVETLVTACCDVAQKLADEGVTEEEVDRLREPILTQIRQSQRQNEFWMSAFGQVHSRPSDLDDIRALMEHYESITAKELSDLAKLYLPKERASILTVHPKQ
jgi:zinc protease